MSRSSLSFRPAVECLEGRAMMSSTIDIVVGAGPGAPGGHVRVFNGDSGSLIAPDSTSDATSTAPGGHVKVIDGTW